MPPRKTPAAVTLDDETRARVFNALSDITRLRIVELLHRHGESSGSRLASELGISLSLFCHHNKVLVGSGLVRVRRQGQTKLCSLEREFLASCLNSLVKSTSTATAWSSR